MPGIFPANGVVPSSTVNGVDVDTNCTQELFYSTAFCQPRLDPAAMNALISEILNVISASGGTYDCSRLDNLATALSSAIGSTNVVIVKPAVSGLVAATGDLIHCEGSTVFANLTGANVTITDITCSGLEAAGLTQVGLNEDVALQTAALVGSVLTLTLTNGSTISVDLATINSDDFISAVSFAGGNIIVDLVGGGQITTPVPGVVFNAGTNTLTLVDGTVVPLGSPDTFATFNGIETITFADGQTVLLSSFDTFMSVVNNGDGTATFTPAGGGASVTVLLESMEISTDADNLLTYGNDGGVFFEATTNLDGDLVLAPGTPNELVYTAPCRDCTTVLTFEVPAGDCTDFVSWLRDCLVADGFQRV